MRKRYIATKCSLSERRVDLRIKRLTRTVTKTVRKSSSGTAAGGINAKGVEMTRILFKPSN